jgi:hypothetical protein
LEKYQDEWKIFTTVMTPVSIYLMYKRIKRKWWDKGRPKERVCFECVKNPLEDGCPQCNGRLDFFIIYTNILESIFTWVGRCFDKLFSIDFLDDTDYK